jgi:5-formyltetrahydrofolate cyclo-ligase
MWDMRTGEKKPALRAAALSRRRSVSQQQAFALSQLIQARVLQFPPYMDAPSVALYSPVQNEAATEEIREHGLHHGKTVFYPRLGAGEAVEFVEVKAASELRRGRFGILEPTGGKILSDQEFVDLILFVPGVAFDPHGNRLGRGMGWYDRFLSRIEGLGTSVALAYEFQIVSEVPSDPWDQKVHYLITESRIIDCRDGSRSRPLS